MSLADEIMRKAKQNPDWDAGKLASYFNCRREYVRTCAKRLGFEFRVCRHKSWGPEDDTRIRDLRENQKMKWGDIAVAMNRPRSSCQGHYMDLVDPPTQRNMVVDRVTVPAERILDRNARVNLEHRDITAAFFNDPKPGYSALDRRPCV